MELILVDATLDLIDAAIDDQAQLATVLDAEVAAGWDGFPEALPALRDATAAGGGNGADLSTPHWGTVFFVVDPPRTLIGMGGYYGPPSPDGIVEIGYAVAPAFQGQGWASRAAALLVDRAAASPAVSAADADTLAEPNATVAVLTTLGFERIGEEVDPDDGPVWHWRRQLGRGNT